MDEYRIINSFKAVKEDMKRLRAEINKTYLTKKEMNMYISKLEKKLDKIVNKKR